MCKPRRRGQISKRYIPPSHHLPVITHPGFILFFSFLFFQNFVDCSDQLFSFLDLDGRQALWSGSSWPPKYAGEFASFISCHFASAPRRNKAPQKWIRKTWQVLRKMNEAALWFGSWCVWHRMKVLQIYSPVPKWSIIVYFIFRCNLYKFFE